MQATREQLMRLLADRGMEWMRRHIMDLPDPCPPDHPLLGPLGRAGHVAPILGGLRGRVSPLEVLVRRRLTPALIGAAAARVMDGARDDAVLQQVQAGAVVAPQDPLWQMACEELAEDASLPLHRRLPFAATRAMWPEAEDALHHAPADQAADIMLQLWQFGAVRPRLRDARAFTDIHARLQLLLSRATALRDCEGVARLIVALHLLDPDFEPGPVLSDLMGAQRPDGSFGRSIGFSTAEQGFDDGIGATLAVVHAFHALAWRRWRGPAPEWLRPAPMTQALRDVARAVAEAQTGPLPAELAAALMLGGVRIAADRIGPADDPRRLARICFGDARVAQRFRSLQAGSDTPEGAWLAGRTVVMDGPLPARLLDRWRTAARTGDDAGFLRMAAEARRHDQRPDDPAIRHAARRIARAALAGGAALDRLERLAILAAAFEPREPVRLAA